MPLSDEEYMDQALAQARTALAEGDIPVGCVVVCDGTVIGSGRNRREQDHDPTAHAEIVAIRAAAKAVNDWRLLNCTLYVTLEPCPMCAAAIALARIKRLVFGAYDFDNGCVGSNGNVLTRPIFGYVPQVTGGIRRNEAETLLEAFFAAIRQQRRGG